MIRPPGRATRVRPPGKTVTLPFPSWIANTRKSMRGGSSVPVASLKIMWFEKSSVSCAMNTSGLSRMLCVMRVLWVGPRSGHDEHANATVSLSGLDEQIIEVFEDVPSRFRVLKVVARSLLQYWRLSQVLLDHLRYPHEHQFVVCCTGADPVDQNFFVIEISVPQSWHEYVQIPDATIDEIDRDVPVQCPRIHAPIVPAHRAQRKGPAPPPAECPAARTDSGARRMRRRTCHPSATRTLAIQRRTAI